MYRKWMLSGWFWIIVVKEIYHFFDSNCIFRNSLSVIDKTSYIRVRSIVYINRKSRNRIGLSTFELIFGKVFVGFGVNFYRRKYLMNIFYFDVFPYISFTIFF